MVQRSIAARKDIKNGTTAATGADAEGGLNVN
jgi:hypothetical protein